MRVLSDLTLGQPFAAEFVQPCLAVLDQRVELAVALEIARQTESEAQIVGPPRFFLRLDDQRPRAVFSGEVVADRLEVAAPVDAPQVPADLLLGKGLAGLALHQRADDLRIGALEPLDADLGDRAELLLLAALQRAEHRVLLRRKTVALERIRQLPRRLFANSDRLGGAIEARRRDVAEVQL